ncbi:hypothetical protein JCM21142_73061 [Saccharicrinis fermentans DSM 9555 = JCM 21142]|uniref:Uncharacterized protein n=2 Tax=Saccharicrinis fermentans TaxID=982 RepID=W7Y9Y8_9BACT|nr:hypothetical protein JCM21142_73061 [Saccharicrinis fermentans DSM 9555 = JCM 21142]
MQEEAEGATIQERGYGFHISSWDSLEQSIIQNPALLQVDWEAISQSSPGLVSNAAVKLALWELYVELKNGYQESPPFSMSEDVNVIYREMIEAMPRKMKKGAVLKEKYMPVFYDVINPSLGFRRKLASLESVSMLTAEEKKIVFDRWHQLISTHVDEKSRLYFQILLKRKVYFKGTLLAVGDGSGSSGLLGEKESGEAGAVINTGTGKGIGLFTYRTKKNKSSVVPDYRSEIDLELAPDEPMLLHLTLWGMDWDKHPLVVVETGEKSYLLFGAPEFSPDHNRVEGTSYYDRIEDYKQRKVDRVIGELNKQGGLLDIYKKEERMRDVIQTQIDSINLEVDSLRELEESNELAIQNRLFKNSVHLGNLSDKERRLKDLQSKIKAVYSELNSAEDEVKRMYAALGDHPQSWTEKDSVYIFEDGSFYHFKTQDLFLLADQEMDNRVRVKLLAATYSIYSDSKDEVQLYVNITGGVSEYLKEYEKKMKPVSDPDTIVCKSYYFDPNAYRASVFFTVEESRAIAELGKRVLGNEKQVRFILVAHGVDSLSQSIGMDGRGTYDVKKNLASYRKSRRVDIQIVECDKEFVVRISGFADRGRTSLLGLPKDVKSRLVGLMNVEQSWNPALSALRVLSVVREIEKLTGLSLRTEKIVCLPMGKCLPVEVF